MGVPIPYLRHVVVDKDFIDQKIMKELIVEILNHDKDIRIQVVELHGDSVNLKVILFHVVGSKVVRR